MTKPTVIHSVPKKMADLDHLPYVSYAKKDAHPLCTTFVLVIVPHSSPLSYHLRHRFHTTFVLPKFFNHLLISQFHNFPVFPTFHDFHEFPPFPAFHAIPSIPSYSWFNS